jgi:hypothetical protein
LPPPDDLDSISRLIVSFGEPGLDRPLLAWTGEGQEETEQCPPPLQSWAACATHSQMPWCAGARGGLSMVVRLPRHLGGLQDALPEEGGAGPAIALALEQLEPGDLPFHGAVAPGQGEPRGDRRQVLP